MRRLQTERGKDLLAVGLIGAVLLALFWPVTFGGRLFLPADMLMIMQPWRAHARELGFERVHTPFLDAIQQAYPWRKYAAEQLRRNTIPLWNPYANCGMPFVGNNQSACFYPETWLFALMAPERAFGWAAFFSLLLGGCFMFGFLRALGLSRAAALAGVFPFLLSGFMIGWMLLPTVRAVPMWLPLMLLAIERIVQRPNCCPNQWGEASSAEAKERRGCRDSIIKAPSCWTSVLAIATGMQFLAGHLHVSFFVLLIAGAYALFRIGQQARAEGWRRAVRSGIWIGVGAILGAGLAMLQLLPVLELAGMSPRAGGVSFATLRQGAMMPAYFLTALMPNLFGNPVDYNYWGAALSPSAREWIETSWYVGLAVLLLMIVAIIAGRAAQRAQIIFWLAVWLGGIGLAWGTPLYHLFYLLVPPLRQLPGVSRAVFLCCFSAAILAALGFEQMRRMAAARPPDVRRLCDYALLALGVLTIVAGLGVWLYTGALEDVLPGIGIYTLFQTARALGILALIGAAVALMTWAGTIEVPLWRRRWGEGLLLLCIVGDLFFCARHFWPAAPAQYLQTPCAVLKLLQQDQSLYRMTSFMGPSERGIDRMPPNLPMAFGFQDLQGSDSLIFRGYTDLWSIIPKDEGGNPSADSPILDLLNARYVLTTLDLSRARGWRRIADYELGVWLNTEALPRAFIASHTELATPAQALEQMKEHFDPRAVAYLSAEKAPRELPMEQGTVRITEYAANVVTVEGLVPTGRLLVLADIYYPGWRAYADQEALPLYRVDYILRGILAPRPLERVRFVYFPASFVVGAFVSCVCVMAIVGLFVMGKGRCLA